MEKYSQERPPPATVAVLELIVLWETDWLEAQQKMPPPRAAELPVIQFQSTSIAEPVA